MAAIPDAGSAQSARRGVMCHRVARVLSRAVVLGGMVVAGWLLGSGIGYANEDPGQSGTNLIQLASYPGEQTAPAEGGSDGHLGVPPTLESAITRALPGVRVPQPTAPPLAQLGILRPITNAADTSHRVLASLYRARLYRAGLYRAGKPGTGIRSQAPTQEPTTALRTEPVGRSSAGTAPVTTLGAATVPAADHAPPAGSIHTAAERSAGRSTFGDDPAAPVPASPPTGTTPCCVISNTASGAVTKNAPDSTMDGSWPTAEAALMYRLRQLAASDLPRSAATQPSTPPD